MISTITKTGDLALTENQKLILAKDEGRKVDIQVVRPSRSNQQNRLYWAYLGIIEAETGNNADDIHEYAKRKFLSPRFIVIDGKEYKVPSSTASLSKSDFTEYLDKICAWSGVPIPDPHEIYGYCDWKYCPRCSRPQKEK